MQVMSLHLHVNVIFSNASTNAFAFETKSVYDHDDYGLSILYTFTLWFW